MRSRLNLFLSSLYVYSVTTRNYMCTVLYVSPTCKGLKNHAVTMFEVGKLTDESLDSFLVELGKVSLHDLLVT